jgi:Fe-S cluster biogenesis protein NfuA
VEGDDWSAVIDLQTQSTLPAGSSSTSPEAQQPVVSPFTTASVHRTLGQAADAAAAAAARASPAAAPSPELEMTPEAVDRVLDEVRPYLIADGGDVEVAAVENGNVYLTLQGSCSSCASSSVTMKMGIERALKAAYGERLREVIQVGQKDPAATVALVDTKLNMLRSAIHSLGGSVEVLAVGGGKCELKYTGPAAIAKGISAAIRDQFHDIAEVVFT